MVLKGVAQFEKRVCVLLLNCASLFDVTSAKEIKVVFTVAVYACVFHIAVQFGSDFIGRLNQGKFFKNAPR